MATALVSLISGRKVKPHLGMTGEITLRGQVLPIGGVKGKGPGRSPQWSADGDPAKAQQGRSR
jgi:predicted ATP-dependent protease